MNQKGDGKFWDQSNNSSSLYSYCHKPDLSLLTIDEMLLKVKSGFTLENLIQNTHYITRIQLLTMHVRKLFVFHLSLSWLWNLISHVNTKLYYESSMHRLALSFEKHSIACVRKSSVYRYDVSLSIGLKLELRKFCFRERLS